MDSLQGQLLIASPGLADPNFARTVVLIAVHGEEGALGLILNREMNTPLPQIWSQVSESECLRTENVRHGGPISGSLMALHDQRLHANLVVTDERLRRHRAQRHGVAGRFGSRPGRLLHRPLRLGARPARNGAGRRIVVVAPRPPPNMSSATMTRMPSGKTP